MIAVALLGGCTADQGDDFEVGDRATEAAWDQERGEICALIREAEAYGVLTRHQIVTLAMETAEVTDPQQRLVIRELIDRDC